MFCGERHWGDWLLPRSVGLFAEDDRIAGGVYGGKKETKVIEGK